MSSRGRLVAGLGVMAAGALAVEAYARVRTPALSHAVSGDPHLARRAEEMLRRSRGPRDRASIAVIDDGAVREAHIGADPHAQYEIGSITKTMTAAVFVDMVERGEVDRHAPVGAFLDFDGSSVADIRLEDLATHTSGLPGMVNSWRNIAGLALWPFRVHDPSASVTLERLLADARRTSPGSQEYVYSNLGYSLLGQALARAAQTSFAKLLEERLFMPLGMLDTFVPAGPSSLPADAALGYSAMWGRRSAPWTLGAEAPSGSVRSTLADMTRYVEALLDGTAPGAAAMEPLAVIGEGLRIGCAWHIDEDSLVWHNGMTGGFSSWVGLRPDRGQGVIVLSNTMNPVDDVGTALAAELCPSSPPRCSVAPGR